MEYPNIDKAARRQAYERVKQLAEAIKKIRKKYYLCFNKISDSDKQRYEQLIAQMQSVARENGLEKSYMQFMRDINTQHGEDLPKGEDANGMPSKNAIEEAYQMYLKALQLLSEFIVQFKKTTDPELEKAYMRRAQKIQSYVKKLSRFLEKSYSKVKLSLEKMNIFSDKFSEQTKGDFCEFLENCYTNWAAKDCSEQQVAQDNIKECTKMKTMQRPTTQISRA